MFYTRGTHLRPIECAWHSLRTKTRRSFVSNWWSVAFSIHNAPDFVSLKECGFLHKRGTRMCPIKGTWYSPYTIHSFVSHWWNVEFSIQKVIVFVPLKECNVLHIWVTHVCPIDGTWNSKYQKGIIFCPIEGVYCSPYMRHSCVSY